ncbi:MAG: hypothetical protein C4293_22495 [Nitrospiraceae bacterium]
MSAAVQVLSHVAIKTRDGAGAVMRRSRGRRHREDDGAIDHASCPMLHRQARTEECIWVRTPMIAPTMVRDPAHAVFLTQNPDMAPLAFVQNVKHNKILHQRFSDRS